MQGNAFENIKIIKKFKFNRKIENFLQLSDNYSQQLNLNNLNKLSLVLLDNNQ